MGWHPWQGAGLDSPWLGWPLFAGLLAVGLWLARVCQWYVDRDEGR